MNPHHTLRTLVKLFLALGLAFTAAHALFTPVAAHAAAPTFDNPLTITTPSHADNMVMGDFDGDGVPDVAVVDGNTGAVQVRFGDGAGAFRATAASFTLTSSNNRFFGVAAADVYGHQPTGNDVSDLVFATGNAAQVWEWNGTAFAKLGQIGLLSTNINATKVAVGDLTGVGHRDILVSDNSGSVGVVVIPNDGAGTFGTPVAYAASGCEPYAKPIIAHTKDATAAGFGDVILSNTFFVSGTGHPSVSVLLNNGNGTLGAQVSYNDVAGHTALSSSQANLFPHGVVVADVDYDGYLDIVTVADVFNTTTHQSIWYLNVNLGAGDGTFAAGKTFQFATDGGSSVITRPVIAAEDLDGDGKPEIVTLLATRGSLTTNPIMGFTVTRFTGPGVPLAVEGQDNYPSDFINYDSIVLGYEKEDGAFATFDNDAQVDVLIGTATNISSPTPAHSQFLVFKNTTPAAPAQLDAPTLTINGSTTPGAIVAGASLAFASTETSTPLGIYVRIQASTSTQQPIPEETWTDLPTGNSGRMIRTGGTGTSFTLNTASYPSGGIHFRAIAAASGYVDNTSPQIGPFTLQAALSIEIGATTTSDPVAGRVVQAGDTITYRLTVTNAAGAPRAEHLQIVDLLPTFTLKNGKPDQVFVRRETISSGGVFVGAPNLQGNVRRALLWKDLGDLDPGASLTVSFRVTLNDKSTGKLKNVARLNSSIFNTVFSVKSTNGKPLAPADGNDAPSRIAVEPKSGVFFTIASKANPPGGDIGLAANILYTLTYENSGSEDAQNVVVSADIPKGVTFVDGDGGFNITGKGVNWVVGTVPAFTSGTRTFKVIVSSDATPNSTFAGGCKVTCEQKASDTDTLPTFTVVTPVKITITGSPESDPTGTNTHRGDTITYTLSYKNVSGAPVKGVILSADIPAHTKLALNSLGKPDDTDALQKASHLIWSLGDLAIGEPERTRTFRVIVGDKIHLDADVTGNAMLLVKDVGKFNFALPNMKVRNPLHIVLTPALIPNPLHAGDGMILQFTCTNASSLVMKNVKINEQIPPFTHFQSASDGGALDSIGQLVWNLGTLNPGEQRIVSFYVTVDFDVDLGSKIFNGNPDVGVKVLYGTPLAVDINQNIARTGFSASADDPVTGKAKGLVASGDLQTVPVFQVSRELPATLPILALSQTATGDGSLLQENPTGNLPPEDVGEIATVVMPPSPADGLLGQITYHFDCSNTGNATAHHLILYVFVPALTTITGTYYFGPDDQHQTPVQNGDVTPSEKRNKHDLQILTVAIGDLAAGASKIFSFKVNVDPSQTGGAIRCEKAQLKSDDYFHRTEASPDKLTVALVPPATFQPDVVVDKSDVYKTGQQNNPAFLKYRISYKNNGSVQAVNMQIACPLPPGGTFLSSTFTGAVGMSTPDNTVIFSDAQPLPKGQMRTFELVTNVENGVVNSDILQLPKVTGRYQRPGASAIARVASASALAATLPPPVAAPVGVVAPEVSRLHAPQAARLVIARRQACAVHPGDYLVYEIAFGNFGDADATNVEIGVGIPEKTTLATDLTDGNGAHVDAVWSGRIIFPGVTEAVTQPKNFKVGGGIVKWNIGTLAAHAGGLVRMVVVVDPKLTECAVRDNTCYIIAAGTKQGSGASAIIHGNAPKRATGTVSTGVLLKNQDFFSGLWRTVGCFFEGVGASISGALHNSPVANAFSNLDSGATFTVVGGSDVMLTHSFGGAEGAYTLPLGGDQVLVIGGGKLLNQDGSGVVAAGGGNIVSHDGGTLKGHDNINLIGHDGSSIVAAGRGDAIALNGIDGSSGGNLLASDLLNNVDMIVSHDGGTVITARGGNLLAQDGSGLIDPNRAKLLANDGSGFVKRGGNLVELRLNTTGVVAAGGGNFVSATGGNVVSNDGGSFIGRAFGSVFALGGTNGVIRVNGGNVVGTAGGSIISGK